MLFRSKSELDRAHTIRQQGVVYQAPVVIDGKTKTCKASIGQYYGGNDLELDLGSTRYRVALNHQDQATKTSEFRVQAINKEGAPGGIRALNPHQYQEAIKTTEEILKAFIRKND